MNMHCALLPLLVVPASVVPGSLLAGERPVDGVYLGRPIAQTMHFLGAPWLVRESREREEEPAKLIGSLGLERGQAVCDMGCGNGFYALRIAPLIAPGEVLAVDIQPEMLQLLEERAEARSVKNVRPILGDPTDPQAARG